MTSFQLVSDLHLEAWSGKRITDFVTPDADVLILAGDIHSNINELIRVLDDVSELYDKVLFVAGNHEYYKSTYELVNNLLYDLEARNNKVNIFTSHRIIDYQGIMIHGCTLWGNMKPHEYMANYNSINDYRRIIKNDKHLSPEEMTIMNEFQSDALYTGIDNDETNLVITHHLPLTSLIDPLYQNSTCNGSFASNQSKIVADKNIAVWCYGHDHSRRDLELSDTRFISNCYGYPREIPNFNDKVFEL